MEFAHSYSIWLAAWTVLVGLGHMLGLQQLQYPPPPTASLLVAAVFTATTALVLPLFNIRVVGVGSARLGLRLMAVAIETGLLLVGMYVNYTRGKHDDDGSMQHSHVGVASVVMGVDTTASIAPQVVVAAVYFAYMRLSGVGVWDHYTRVLPHAAADRTLDQYIRERTRTRKRTVQRP
jgi:hypothetical protein